MHLRPLERSRSSRSRDWSCWHRSSSDRCWSSAAWAAARQPDARQFAVLTGQNIVEPTLRDGVLSGDPSALGALDRIVQERVLSERIVRVKLWSADGRIVYSDESRLIGERFPLDDEKLSCVAERRVRAERPRGCREPLRTGTGKPVRGLPPIRAPDGTPLLYETYQRGASVSSTGRRIWLPFAGLLLASLFLLWLVQVPLAWRLAQRLQRSQEERAALLVRALEASDDERRRIAADLHDGVVQDLAGVSYSLSSVSEQPDAQSPEEMRSTVRQAAGAIRDAMRRLRSALVEIHPPSLQAAGLEAALADVVAPLAADHVETTIDVTGEPLPDDVERLFYRAAGGGPQRGGTPALRRCPSASRATTGWRSSRSSTTGRASPRLSGSGAGPTAMSASRCSKSSPPDEEGASTSRRRPAPVRRSCSRYRPRDPGRHRRRSRGRAPRPGAAALDVPGCRAGR